MTRELRNTLLTLRRITQALEAVINATPSGAPSGLLYVPLSPFVSVAEFEALMRLLVEAGRVSRCGDRYYPAPEETLR